MRSVGPVLVEVEVAGPSPCMGPRDGFLDLKSFLTMRFISLMIKVKVTLFYGTRVLKGEFDTMSHAFFGLVSIGSLRNYN